MKAVGAAVFIAVALSAPVRAAEVARYTDISYLNGGGKKQLLELDVPTGKSSCPVLMFVHGGGWVIGDRSWHEGLGERLAQSGIGVAIPSYRLLSVAMQPYPAQVEDIAAAFAWIHE